MLDARLNDRQIRRERRARERLHDDALPRLVHFTIEQRQTPPAEQLLHMRRHRPFAHDHVRIDETSRRVGAGDNDRLAAEEVRAKDAAMFGETLFEKTKWVLYEGKRFAGERNAVAAGCCSE